MKNPFTGQNYVFFGFFYPKNENKNGAGENQSEKDCSTESKELLPAILQLVRLRRKADTAESLLPLDRFRKYH